MRAYHDGPALVWSVPASWPSPGRRLGTCAPSLMCVALPLLLLDLAGMTVSDRGGCGRPGNPPRWILPRRRSRKVDVKPKSIWNLAAGNGVSWKDRTLFGERRAIVLFEHFVFGNATNGGPDGRDSSPLSARPPGGSRPPRGDPLRRRELLLEVGPEGLSLARSHAGPTSAPPLSTPTFPNRDSLVASLFAESFEH